MLVASCFGHAAVAERMPHSVASAIRSFVGLGLAGGKQFFIMLLAEGSPVVI